MPVISLSKTTFNIWQKKKFEFGYMNKTHSGFAHYLLTNVPEPVETSSNESESEEETSSNGSETEEQTSSNESETDEEIDDISQEGSDCIVDVIRGGGDNALQIDAGHVKIVDNVVDRSSRYDRDMTIQSYDE